jgi:hypothetical protein
MSEGVNDQPFKDHSHSIWGMGTLGNAPSDHKIDPRPSDHQIALYENQGRFQGRVGTSPGDFDNQA